MMKMDSKSLVKELFQFIILQGIQGAQLMFLFLKQGQYNQSTKKFNECLLKNQTSPFLAKASLSFIQILKDFAFSSRISHYLYFFNKAALFIKSYTQKCNLSHRMHLLSLFFSFNNCVIWLYISVYVEVVRLILKYMRLPRHFAHKQDLFAAAPTLRVYGEPQVANCCTGVFSILLMAFFVYVLIDINVKVLNYSVIKANQRIESNAETLRAQNISSFAILFEDHNITELAPMFRFYVHKVTMNGTFAINDIEYELELCTDPKWVEFGHTENADHLQLLCLKNGQTIQLINDPDTGFHDLLHIDIHPCSIQNNSIYSGCWDQATANAFAEEHISKSLFFTVRLYVPNVAFNPAAQNAILDRISEIRTTFTYKRGTQKTLYMDHYRVDTDMSLLPFVDKQIKEGWMLGEDHEASFQIVNDFHYVRIIFQLSEETTRIDRVIGKFDDSLSYVGGLFGIICAFFGVFLLSFNQYRYELMVGQNAFNYSSDGSKMRKKDFHFFHYLKYCFYDWFDLLFACELGEWGRCKQIHETRGQANEQLNVTYMFRRLQYYERVFEYILSKDERMALYLTEPPSMDDVAKTRKCSEYYKKIIRGKSATTLEDIEIIEDVMAFGVDLASGKPPKPRLQKVDVKENKEGFVAEVHKSRENILDLALEIFAEEAKVTELKQGQQDQLDKEVQREMAEALQRLPHKTKAIIQQKIPLKILNRLKKVHEQKALPVTQSQMILKNIEEQS